MDNADPDFSITGFWLTYSGSTYPAYNGGFRYHAAGVGNNSATFRPSVPVADYYQVSIWFGTSPYGATDAPWTINYDGGSHTVTVNLLGPAGGGYWLSLGSYPFAAGTAGTVVTTDDANGYVVADAIRLLQVGGP